MLDYYQSSGSSRVVNSTYRTWAVSWGYWSTEDSNVSFEFDDVFYNSNAWSSTTSNSWQKTFGCPGTTIVLSTGFNDCIPPSHLNFIQRFFSFSLP